jgi:hypothetical protein
MNNVDDIVKLRTVREVYSFRVRLRTKAVYVQIPRRMNKNQELTTHRSHSLAVILVYSARRI